MRFLGLVAALLVLGGCDQASMTQANATKSGADALVAADQAITSGNYDYQLAFRLPPSRIAQVQDAHVRACDQLGPGRCRVTSVRYHVGSDNQVSAVLALMLDPSIARDFGQNAGRSVVKGGGALVDSRMAGSNAAGNAGRAGNVVARLRDEIATIDTQLRGNVLPAQKAPLIDKQNRLRAAIQTIGELDQGALQGIATSPVLFTYVSGTTLPALGGSPEASFYSAGDTFLASLAGLTQVLAGVGPWLLVLIGGALLLRRIIPQEAPAPVPAPAPAAPHEPGIIQRIFNRDQHADDHHEDAPAAAT